MSSSDKRAARGMQAAVAVLATLLVGAIAGVVVLVLMRPRRSYVPCGMYTMSSKEAPGSTRVSITRVASDVAAPSAPTGFNRIGAITMLIFMKDGSSQFVSATMYTSSARNLPGTPTALALYSNKAGQFFIYVPGAGWMGNGGPVADASKAVALTLKSLPAQ